MSVNLHVSFHRAVKFKKKKKDKSVSFLNKQKIHAKQYFLIVAIQFVSKDTDNYCQKFRTELTFKSKSL